MRLSKSRYCADLLCLPLLWWRSVEPAAPELGPDAPLEPIFNQGHAVGLAPQSPWPRRVLIDFPHHAYDEKPGATRLAIEAMVRGSTSAPVLLSP